jgi:hypothetical protein
LIRGSLRCYREIIALADFTNSIKPVKEFSELKIIEKVLLARAEGVHAQLLKMADSFVAQEPPATFSRKLMRFYCQLLYPVQAIQSYRSNNFETFTAGADEAVSVLQHELDRLDCDVESVFEMVHSVTINTGKDLKEQILKKRAEPQIFFMFADVFFNITKMSFLDHFVLLSSQFPEDKQRDRLLRPPTSGPLRPVPIIGLIGGRVGLFFNGELLECSSGKSLLKPLCLWIVYLRDVLRCDIFRLQQLDSLRSFIQSYFPSEA